MSFPRGYVLVILLMLYTVSVLHLYFGSFANGTPKLHIVFILRVIVPSNNHFLCFSVLRNRSIREHKSISSTSCSLCGVCSLINTDPLSDCSGCTRLFLLQQPFSLQQRTETEAGASFKEINRSRRAVSVGMVIYQDSIFTPSVTTFFNE